MDYLTKVSEDMKTAMKNQDKDRLSALRMLKSTLIENKTAAAPKPEMDVIISHCKKLQSSLETFPDGDINRSKLAQEIEYLKIYLPEQLTAEAVKQIIQEILGRLVKPNVGMVMKELSPQIKGKFDGKTANQFVQEMLK